VTKLRRASLLATLAAALLAAGCGRSHSGHDDHAGHPHHEGHDHDDHDDHEDHDHGHDDHEHEETSGADFDPESGILLAEPAREMIGLETAEVTRLPMTLEVAATARVFHSAHQHGDELPGHQDGHAYANAFIPVATAELLKVGQPVELDLPGGGKLRGRLSSLDLETARAIGQVEAVIEIPDPDERFEFGAFLTARLAGAERTVRAIPRSALVDAASGTFVYARNGDRWKRAPVEIGGASKDHVEIVGGLSEGDIVVSRGAIDLWLIELRFTKGGGHSH
jgi:multidrug efflux pump subunit AcrA (membrane-fusion protein)